MVAAVSSTPNPKLAPRAAAGGGALSSRPKRPPLLPSDSENNGRSAAVPRPKPREVSSRYLSSNSSNSSSTTSSNSASTTSTTSFSSSSNASFGSTSNLSTPKRFPSPAVRNSGSRPSTPKTEVIKRSVSAERRRPATPRPAGEFSTNAAKQLMNSSSRSLSVSFQGDSFPVPVSKGRNGVRNGTPERRKDAVPVKEKNGVRSGTPERWKGGAPVPTPNAARSQRTESDRIISQQKWPVRTQGGLFTKSVDFSSEKNKLFASDSVVRALENSLIDNLRCSVNLESVASDTESVSSESTSGSVGRARGGQRGVVVPARFWQETVNRIKRVPEPVTPMSKSNKMISLSKSLNSGPTMSPRGMSSPIRGAGRPASPNKAAPAPSRGMPSPPRVRNGVAALNGILCDTPSINGFAAEARRGKVGENRISDAHLLRLLNNKYLQWRFANARANAAMTVQRVAAERSLYNGVIATSKLWHSVISKRIEVQLLRQNLKLYSILRKEMPFMDNWDTIENDYSTSLSGATVSLQSSTLRLPLIGGAKGDIQDLKDAICSTVDVMQGMASSICSLLPKVEDVSALSSELASTKSSESDLLDQCKDLLSTVAAMQVKDCSLRTHILQQKRVS